MVTFWFCMAMLFLVLMAIAISRKNEVEAIWKKQLANQQYALRCLEESKALDLESKARLREANRTNKEAYDLNEKTKELETSLKHENDSYNRAIETVVNLWVNDSWKSICDKLTAGNYEQQKNRLSKIFEKCRVLGLDFNPDDERTFYTKLETAWKQERALARAKEEQARVREVMREEAAALKSRAAEIKQLETERKEQEAKHKEHIERIKMLQDMEALKKLSEEQSIELQTALAENQQLEKEILENERRKSMAEMTKAGHVYVISNVGSFGDKVFKVGMTRRLIPEERVKELGDASVPFPFDVHLMIATTDAPALESKLHAELWDHRLNLINNGKEFFKTDIHTIKTLVDKHSGGVVYEFKEQPEASQWRETELKRQAGDVGTYKRARYTIPSDEEAA